MKAFPKLIVAAACTAVSLQAQTLRISDFRIPDSFFERLSTSMSGRYNASDSEENLPGSSSSSLSHGLDVSPSYRLFLSSEPSAHNLFARLQTNIASGQYSRIESSPSYRLKRNSNSQSWGVYADWQGSSYLDDSPVYWYASFNGDGYYSQQKTHVEQSDTAVVWKYDEREKDRSYNITVGAGWGVGRIRNGLPVFSVLRILDRLREDEALLREPERDEILRLVQIYARLHEYYGRYERSTKHFFGDLFSAMESMGIVQSSGLAAYSVVRTLEVLTEYHYPRLFGWRIQAGLEHRSSQSETFYTTSYQRSRSANDNLNVKCEAGHDLSLETHAYAEVNLKAGLFHRVASFAELSGRGTVTYDLGERIEVQTSITYTRYHDWRVEGSVLDPGYYHSNFQSILNIRFFIEDRVVLNLNSSYGFSSSTQHSAAFPTRTATDNGANASIGIDYRFF